MENWRMGFAAKKERKNQMKKMYYRTTSILMFATLFLIMPLKSTFAQKLISETLQSKTLVEEDDGFKWYRYTYEYQVKYKGNTVRFTRESAYSANEKKLIDGEFDIDQIKRDCESKYTRKDYKKYPSKIKEKYTQTVEYDAFYGLFIVNRDISSNKFQGSFFRDGKRCTERGWLSNSGNGMIKDGGDYGDYGVVKNGEIVIPIKYDQMKVENGLYFGGRYSDRGEEYPYYAEVYTPKGAFIGNVGEKYGKDELSKEFFDGPNGEKWLKYGNKSYSEDNGFYYCITSGKKIDWGYNKHYDIGHDNIDKYLKIGGNLYTGNGEQITNYSQKTRFTYLFNDGSADLFVVEKGGDNKQKGLIKIEGNQAKEVIPCEYYEINCLNADNGGDLFLVTKPYNGDIYRDGLIKVEGSISKVLLDCIYNYSQNTCWQSNGLFGFDKKTTGYFNSSNVVINDQGNVIIPFGRYSHLGFDEKDRYFHGYKQLGNTVYLVKVDLDGNEFSCERGFDITSKSGNTTTTQTTKQETVTPTSTSTSSSSSSTSSTTNGSGNDKGLLYKGEYTICRSRQYDELTGNPMGISASDETQVVEIYEDHVYLGVHYCEYQSTNNRGERVYKDNLNKDATLYVSPNFDIRYYWSMTSMYGSCNVVIPVEKGTSYMSGGNGGYSAPQQGGYNGGNIGGNDGGNSGSNTSTSSKTHKCSLCNGTGRVIENNGTSFGNTKYCSECGKTVPDYHYHTTCPSCNGKGYW